MQYPREGGKVRWAYRGYQLQCSRRFGRWDWWKSKKERWTEGSQTWACCKRSWYLGLDSFEFRLIRALFDLLVVVLVLLSSEFQVLLVLEQVLLVGKRFFFLVFQFRIRVVVSIEISELHTYPHDQPRNSTSRS